ncbi:hypothetical protein [Sporisorium scitamineum]|uniref:Uncharacterized protein n=1 Tax=Sporisorium scitamineum TaxID=49012 RepID=A0A0F7S6W7_9BASI|nr:hypothetical protein [Sporisorium scitamineum]
MIVVTIVAASSAGRDSEDLETHTVSAVGSFAISSDAPFPWDLD